jgi:hypothetical protein
MRQIPLRGGPLDGATVPAREVHDGRYTVRRVASAPPVTFGPGPVTEDSALRHETVVYELRRTRTPEYTATHNEAVRLRREYADATEEERRDLVSMVTRVKEHLLWFHDLESRMYADEWLEFVGTTV